MIHLARRLFGLLASLLVCLVIALLLTPGGLGHPSSCGPPVATHDPDLRRSFERFERSQSAAAREICQLYRNPNAWH
jgi:hypothetical protein